ncbi:MAG: winged helix-turn-helix transcriptional regulator [Inquilinaceae bacterium]
MTRPTGKTDQERPDAPSETPSVLEPHYPARRVLDLIADKWTPIVLYCLTDGADRADGADGADRTRRFNELRRHIPDISKKMLTQTLRSLERDGLVERTVHAQVPPRTEYRLTADGRTLREPIAWLCRWATDHRDLVDRIATKRR